MSDTKQKEKSYTSLEVKELSGSEIEITAEIPVAVVEKYHNKAVRNLQKTLELPGFRKGHVPEDAVIKHVGEQAFMHEVAQQALGDVYADIAMNEKLDVVGRPEVTITKLASGNPIGFKIKSAVFPEVTLPDYKKLAEKERKNNKEDKVEITEEDMKAELDRLQKALTPPAEKGEDGKEVKPEPPVIDDEFAKKLGDFKDLADLKEKMKAQMLMDKETKAKEKRRLSLIDTIIAKTKVEVPALFIEGEIDQMVASFTDRVKQAGMEMDAYLKQANKTMEDLRKEWRPDAEKKAKMQLIFNEIAKEEKIVPDDAKLDREIKHLKEHYPDAEENPIRTYVTAQMTNELVFEFLEGKEKTEEKEEHACDGNCDHNHK